MRSECSKLRQQDNDDEEEAQEERTYSNGTEMEGTSMQQALGQFRVGIFVVMCSVISTIPETTKRAVTASDEQKAELEDSAEAESKTEDLPAQLFEGSRSVEAEQWRQGHGTCRRRIKQAEC